jgi:hypothetical protein
MVCILQSAPHAPSVQVSMPRSLCWRLNSVVSEGVQLSDVTVNPINSVFCAAVRAGNTISYFYRFRYGMTLSTLEKMIATDGLWIPVRWSYIRRWLMDGSEERVIIKGLSEFPLSDPERPTFASTARDTPPAVVNSRDPRLVIRACIPMRKKRRFIGCVR